MNLVWAALAAVGLGLVTNELFDLAPSLARFLLRRAARLEAETPGEAPLIYEELFEILDEVPGNLTKLFYAIGQLTFALQYLRWRWLLKRNLASLACSIVLIGASVPHSAGGFADGGRYWGCSIDRADSA